MRILIFGGGFDPPHRGHAELLKAAAEQLRPDETYVVPAWRSPTKDAHGASAADRLAMAGLVARKAGARLDRFELLRRRRTYTYEVLREFARKRPGAELWFLIGSDSLATLHEWKRPGELKRLGRWLVGRRPGSPARAPAGFRVRFLKGRFPSAASTEARARLYAGEDWRSLLPKKVAAYVERKGLYGLDLHEELERTLSKDRYRHTLEVARLAAGLARRHGEDPAAAALAGLLHDAGRRFDPAGMIRYARRRRLPVPALAATLRNSPLLTHAYISADLAERRFGVDDPKVLEAIAEHTLGRPGMSRFARLLYVADFASADRGFPSAARVRRLAARDLDRAFREAARLKTHWVRKLGRWNHPITARVLEFAESL